MIHQPRRIASLAGVRTLAVTLVVTLVCAWGVGLVSLRAAPSASPAMPPPQETIYRPKLATPETLEPFLKNLEPGNDQFTSEREVRELQARLAELSDLLKTGNAASVADRLLATDFRGGRLLDPDRPPPSALSSSNGGRDATFEVTRSQNLPRDLSLDARRFTSELTRLISDTKAIATAEFLIISIDSVSQSSPATSVRTRVRYDIVGSGGAAWHAEHVGVWNMTWRRAASDGGGSGWRIAEWITEEHVGSRSTRAVFTEVTQAALGGNDSFNRQLSTDLDTWNARIDSVLTRDSNGHHGVSAGDADGDGLDDLYIAQPAGLPNRLFRARGDGTYEDITEAAGVGVLDDTAQSLFADIDNDGDQDLVLATGTRPLLFINDGKGHFTLSPDAFQFEKPLQGSLTSMAMADYDRDGFLDLYLCVYAYFYGAGEDKAGTPAPYYDARNGPPGILFHNDGHGHFVESTTRAGLTAGNDRYHFAAAWADYNGDGWPDLLVANDFGTKNLYRNRGAQNGIVTFEDVSAEAGLLDYGAGMSAAFLDYDNDGLLDIYTGNMWSPNGLRVTASPAFMPDAPADIRAFYQRHARGNSLFRNRGDGHFDDKTLEAHAEMGRWAWSSDGFDFDSDGFEDLYIVNGMLTRKDGPEDLDGFFWRQVVARSPLTRVKGTTYDEAWRAINHWLVHDSIASHQRNVFLRNNGHGGFDDVSGAVGLDFDQDGRSFAAIDIDRDGDPDLVLMAARQAPELRIFRNDFAPRGASLAIRLTGTGKADNRDAIGARVIVDTDRVRRTKEVQAGSGFISQQSKELLFGLGASQQVRTLTIAWPSGQRQTFNNVPVNVRLKLVEGGELQQEPFASPSGGAESGAVMITTRRGESRSPVSAAAATASATAPAPAAAPDFGGTWLYEPMPAPDFSAADLSGQPRSIAALRGAPALLLFWSTTAAGSRPALDALASGRDALSKAGITAIAIAMDPTADAAKVRAMASALPAAPGASGAVGGLAVIHATPDLALTYAILHRHIFMNRLDLRLPTAMLLDASGRVVKIYRGANATERARIIRDAGAIDVSPEQQLTRAMPFAGTLYTQPSMRNYLPYGRELLDQGLDAAAVAAFQRAAQQNPTAPTLYRLGTLLTRSGDPAGARAAYERALALQPDLAEASNDLGALLARSSDIDGAIVRFRAALAAAPEYPDALNNLGFALLLTGHEAEARSLYEKALALQPDFPEALNNLGMLLGRAGDLDRAEHYFRDALTRRPEYGEAANNLALVLVNRGQPADAVRFLESFLQKNPQSESTYVILAKIYVSTNQPSQAEAVLQRLLQRHPNHPLALELLKQTRP